MSYASSALQEISCGQCTVKDHQERGLVTEQGVRDFTEVHKEPCHYLFVLRVHDIFPAQLSEQTAIANWSSCWATGCNASAADDIPVIARLAAAVTGMHTEPV